MKPLFKWSGGKAREIKNFKMFYPWGFDRYIEPFVGAGSVFFDLNFKNNIISDTHYELINFYQQIKEGNSKRIYELMKEQKYTEEEYYYIRDDFSPSNKIEEAFRFLYLRKTCYRGMLRYNNKGHFNIPFGRYKNINYDVLLNKNYEDLLKRTEIYNNSYEEIFEKYNSNENFIFLDPPYDSTFKKYGTLSFDREQHLNLFHYFTSTKNRCLLIIGKSDFIESLYEKYIHGRYWKKYLFRIHSNRITSDIDNEHLIIRNFL
jgi:DNA adenine methylase